MKIYGIGGTMSFADEYYECYVVGFEIYRSRKGMDGEPPCLFEEDICPFFSSSTNAKKYIEYLEKNKNREKTMSMQFKDDWRTYAEELEVVEIEIKEWMMSKKTNSGSTKNERYINKRRSWSAD